jgi:DNA-binding Xre family transcriptional regulator
MTNLGNMITAFQQKHDVENREMARQIDIGASTLSRLKQGTLPDADGLAKIILWMTRETK